MESRSSTRLGQNVQLLTYVSIFYLPLAFCAVSYHSALTKGPRPILPHGKRAKSMQMMADAYTGSVGNSQRYGVEHDDTFHHYCRTRGLCHICPRV